MSNKSSKTAVAPESVNETTSTSSELLQAIAERGWTEEELLRAAQQMHDQRAEAEALKLKEAFDAAAQKVQDAFEELKALDGQAAAKFVATLARSVKGTPKEPKGAWTATDARAEGKRLAAQRYAAKKRAEKATHLAAQAQA